MDQRTKVLLLGTGLAGFILLGIAQGIFGPVLPVYARHFSYDVSTVSWLLSLFWAGSLASVAGVYLMPARLGPKSGLVFSALGTALLALMGSWTMVLIGAALFGIGYGIIAAVYNPRVLAAFGPRGPAMMSLLNATFTLGAIAAPRVFLTLDQDPVAVFWLITGFTGAILLAALAMGDTRSETPKAEGAGPLRIDWLVLVVAALGIGMESSFVGLGPTALILAGETPEDAARLLSSFFVTYLVARVLLVFVAHRVPAFVFYGGAMALLSATAAGAVWGDAAFWFPLIGFPCGLFFHGAYMTGLQRMGGTTQVSAMLLAACIIGAIVQPRIIAQFLDAMGPKGFFQIILGLATGLTLLAALNLRRLSRD